MGWNSANRPKFLLSSAQIRSHLQMISRKHHSSNVATWSYNQNPSNILPYHHPIVLPWYPYITYPLPRYALTWRIYALPWRIYALTWRIYINTDTLLYMRHLNIYIYIDRYIYIYIITIYSYLLRNADNADCGTPMQLCPRPIELLIQGTAKIEPRWSPRCWGHHAIGGDPPQINCPPRIVGPPVVYLRVISSQTGSIHHFLWNNYPQSRHLQDLLKRKLTENRVVLWI